MVMGKRWRKFIYLCREIKNSFIQPQPKTINFPNLGSLNKQIADFGCLRV